jgi:hypothetical protein
MRTLLSALFGCLLLIAGGCQSASSPAPPAPAALIDSARAAHGSDVLNHARMTFTFREASFRLRHHRNGRFHYRRTLTDSLGRTVVEGLTNDGPYRVLDGDTTTLSPEARVDVETAVNSVAYFARLPAPLNDPAVRSSYSGRDTIDGTPYHRLRVTFQQEGGGRDWQDIFYYWFHAETYTMDYLAYAYGLGPDEETGTRFRAAYNARRRGGVRIADYENYTADSMSPDQMPRYPERLAQGNLDLVSRVALDSVRVRPLPDS